MSRVLFVLCSIGLVACGDDATSPADGSSLADLGVGADGAVPVEHCVGSAAGAPILGAGEMLKHEDVIVGGLYADRYVWRDADGRPRSVSLKKQCAENGGNGGYAIEMTYQPAAGTTRTLGANDGDDGGFGYFVSHEAYRKFSDGTEDTVASKHGEDDSALGKGFPVTATSNVTGASATHVFSLAYYRWGTKAAAPYDDATGTIPTPAATTEHVRYDLPVTITWSFAAGSNYPLVRTRVDQTKIPGPDRVFFDVRGPYGVLAFDEGKGLTVQGLFWADRFHSFKNVAVPLTWASGGDWSGATIARYHALVAGDYEMGLYEPAAVAASALADGYSDHRGKPAAAVGCADDPALKLPCAYEWPYQSLNYSLDPSTPNVPTDGKKLAWGSTPYYGSSLAAVGAGPGMTQPFDGRAGGVLTYDVCVVVDRPVAAQGADGASTIQSKTAAVANVAANRAPGGLCAVIP